MSTFEGPMLSLKNVNAIAHYTDWIPAHVHIGTLGWNGFLIFGMFYWIIPRIYQTKIYSKKLANIHFWIGTLGIIFWALPMYWAGFTQSLMWKEFTADGYLAYGNFLETVTQIIPMYITRSFGGLLYLIGVFIMIFNMRKTVKNADLLSNEAAEAPALVSEDITKSHKGEHWHRWIERRPIQMLVFSLLAILVGTLIELIPTMVIKDNVPTIASVKPYTPLELEGRDLYIREGCNACHSQMIRPFRSETERYGEYSKAGEFVYDHPHLWGSKRTGPDLHRIGKKYNHAWHFNHMYDPTMTSPGSIMPRYQWLFKDDLDVSLTEKKIVAMQKLGVPYEKGFEKEAVQNLQLQAIEIADELKIQLQDPVTEIDENKEIIALIAYMQRLGTDIKKEK